MLVLDGASDGFFPWPCKASKACAADNSAGGAGIANDFKVRNLPLLLSRHAFAIAARCKGAIAAPCERRAIANFGDPHVIAAQFGAVSLPKQTMRVGVAVVLVVAGVFIVMKRASRGMP
jgi:hypothetical protein